MFSGDEKAECSIAAAVASRPDGALQAALRAALDVEAYPPAPCAALVEPVFIPQAQKLDKNATPHEAALTLLTAYSGAVQIGRAHV